MNEDWKVTFSDIKKAYAKILPYYMHEYRVSGSTTVDPYFYDWQFTHIESMVWQDIRGAGLPFLPQFPTNGYFIDFADPFKRIAIECDGKDFHDAEKDAKRDAVLEANGWVVYRIPGWQCNKITDERPLSVRQQDQDMDSIKEWLLSTSEGLVCAIKEVYYGDGSWEEKPHASYIQQTMNEHRSTTNFAAFDLYEFMQYMEDM